MTRVRFVDFQGHETTVEIDEGLSLMEGATQNAVSGIESDCGGECACGTCKVLVDAAWIDKTGLASEDEREMLEFRGEAPRFARLACQIKVTADLDGMTVHTPKNQDGQPEFAATAPTVASA